MAINLWRFRSFRVVRCRRSSLLMGTSDLGLEPDVVLQQFFECHRLETVDVYTSIQHPIAALQQWPVIGPAIIVNMTVYHVGAHSMFP